MYIAVSKEQVYCYHGKPKFLSISQQRTAHFLVCCYGSVVATQLLEVNAIY